MEAAGGGGRKGAAEPPPRPVDESGDTSASDEARARALAWQTQRELVQEALIARIAAVPKPGEAAETPPADPAPRGSIAADVTMLAKPIPPLTTRDEKV